MVTDLRQRSDNLKAVKRQEFKSTSKHGQLFFDKVLSPVTTSVEEWLEAWSGRTQRHTPEHIELVRRLEPSSIAVITLVVCLDNLHKDLPTDTALAIRIAQYLEQEINTPLYEERNPEYLAFCKKHFPSHRNRRLLKESAENGEFGNPNDFIDIPETTKVRLGKSLIELLVKAGLLCIHKSYSKASKVSWSIEVLEWSQDTFKELDFLKPSWVPLVKQPSNYDVEQKNNSYGDKFPAVDFKLYSSISPNNTEPGLNIDAANKLAKVPYRINTDVFNVVKQLWNEGIEVEGLVNRNAEEIPPKIEGLLPDDPVVKERNRNAHRIYLSNAKKFGRRVTTSRTLSLINEYLDDDLYFLWQADFRGRLYPVTSSLLNPQGSDLSRSLLTFSRKKRLGTQGLYWLQVHTANCYGIDKASFNDRVTWCSDNLDIIREVASRPIDSLELWADTDKPFQFLAACIDLSAALDKGDASSYESSLPIHLDGSCSGIQHYSLLLRDKQGAESVNLCRSLSSLAPRDVYSDVLVDLYEHIAQRGDGWTDLYKQGRLTRKLTKRCTMTYVYSATVRSFSIFIKDFIVDLLKKDGRASLPDSLFDPSLTKNAYDLSPHVKQVIEQRLTATAQGMKWLRDCVKIIHDAGYPNISWTTPTGFQVIQAYKKQEAKRVVCKTFPTSAGIRSTLRKNTDETSRSKSCAAIAPNFIHSLDAAHLVNTVLSFDGDITVVHDSFGTHAATVLDMRETLVDMLIKQYTPNVLMKLWCKWTFKYKLELPRPPVSGDYMLDELYSAVYAFS